MSFNYKLLAQIKQAAGDYRSPPLDTHVSPTVTKHPNVNPTYPRVKFGPTDDPTRVVKTDTSRPIPNFNPNYGALQPGMDVTTSTYLNPGKEKYRHQILIPSFGNISKNIPMGNIPGANERTLENLADDFYMGDTRKDFYNSLDKTLKGSAGNLKQFNDRYVPPLSGRPTRNNLLNQTAPSRSSYLAKNQENENYKNFSTSLKNMASWASDNRISKPTVFETEPEFTGEAMSGFSETSTDQDPKDQLHQRVLTQYKLGDKPSKMSPFNKTMNPNAVFLHELEHTNQAIAPRHPKVIDPNMSTILYGIPREIKEYIEKTHTANDEIPTVISEIAHQAAAAHEATGKYPKGDFYGVPYETIAREAQRRGHVYGNVPMTELLKHPDAQKWLKQVAKGMR
jgi:hypothetical protein